MAVYLKWPLRLLTASEVTSDLNFELSGLNNLCSSASLASILLEKPFVTKVSSSSPSSDCAQMICRLVGTLRAHSQKFKSNAFSNNFYQKLIDL